MSARLPGLAALVPFFLAYYLSYLLRSVNAVIAPELSAELDVGAAELGFLTSTYFLAFAAAQLPVGLALDRFGPRRVVASLMALATGGVLVFALAGSFPVLAVGRGLMGFGVSACLMGALQAAAAGYPASRQTSLTGLIMAAGATGALTASVPLEALLPVVGWRGALLGVAALCALVAALVALAVPAALSPSRTGGDWGTEVRALGQVLRSRAFWRFAPQSFWFTGGFMAVQGLWVVPWAMTVEGRSRAGAATLLLALSLGMLAGQLAVGVTAGRLERAGWHRRRMMAAGIALALLLEATIVGGIALGPVPWFLVGATSAVGAQVYGVASAGFAPTLSGRVSTALNKLAFLGAFLLQWGIGITVEALAAHFPPAPALQLTLAVLWLAKCLALGWSLRGGMPSAGGEAGQATLSHLHR